MTLYEIDSKLEEAMEKAIDPETGEMNDEEALEEFEKLSLERDAKIEGIALWIKNMKSDAEAIKKEKLALEDRQKSLENKAERVSAFLKKALAGEKFQTAKVAISYRKSTSVEVEDNAVEYLSIDYLKVKKEPNKTLIKDFLKSGGQLPGCKLVENNNMSIK